MGRQGQGARGVAPGIDRRHQLTDAKDQDICIKNCRATLDAWGDGDGRIIVLIA